MTHRQREALTPKQRRFVEAFKGDATQAARVAGYSATSLRSLQVAASKLLAHAGVRLALEAAGKLRGGPTKSSSTKRPRAASTPRAAPVEPQAPPLGAAAEADDDGAPDAADIARLAKIANDPHVRPLDRIAATREARKVRADLAAEAEARAEASAATAPARLAAGPFVVWHDNGRVPPPGGGVADLVRRMVPAERRALVAELGDLVRAELAAPAPTEETPS